MIETRNHPQLGRHSPASPRKAVNFYCAAPAAKTVQLAGDFNQWHPLDMRRALDGWWFVTVALGPGHHQYRFLVDGKPILDPSATGVVRDHQDEPASLIAVG